MCLDSMNQKVDEALSIYDVSEYPDEFTYEQLLQAPVRNYSIENRMPGEADVRHLSPEFLK